MIDSVSSSTHRMLDQRDPGSSLAAAARAAAVAAAAVASTAGDGTTLPTQKTPFAIQELLGLTSGDQGKNSVTGGSNSGLIGSNAHVNSVASAGAASMGAAMAAGANFPPISCYNSSFFNSSAVDTYNQHQRMFYNSAGLFGNFHHQSGSFGGSSASQLLDSTLRNEHSLSSKDQLVRLTLLL